MTYCRVLVLSCHFTFLRSLFGQNCYSCFSFYYIHVYKSRKRKLESQKFKTLAKNKTKKKKQSRQHKQQYFILPYKMTDKSTTPTGTQRTVRRMSHVLLSLYFGSSPERPTQVDLGGCTRHKRNSPTV